MSWSRRRFLSLSGVAMAAAATHRLGLGSESKPVPSEFEAGMNAFAIDLYKKLSQTPGNLAFSPASLSTALSMTSAGARGNTLTEMNSVLHLPANPHAEFGKFLSRVFAIGVTDIKRLHTLDAANGIWAQQGYPWRDEFKTIMTRDYHAGLVDADFGKPEPARLAINSWIEKATHERIKNLLPEGSITVLTRMVLANAVYFKGDWAAPFKKEKTKPQPFHVGPEKQVQAPMMDQLDDFDYAEVEYGDDSRAGDTAQVLSLPYAGNELSMLLILPKRQPLSVLERKLTAKNLAKWCGELQPRTVRVQMPKFKFDPKESMRLNEPLQELGMKDAFDDAKADFTGLHTGKDPLFITLVAHKAFVEVNEDGTEAAAGTGVVVGLRGAARDIPFRADKPFLYAIRENRSGIILFLGRITDPTA